MKSILGSFKISLNDHAGNEIPYFQGLKDLVQNNLVFTHLIYDFGRKPVYIDIRRKTKKFN